MTRSGEQSSTAVLNKPTAIMKDSYVRGWRKLAIFSRPRQIVCTSNHTAQSVTTRTGDWQIVRLHSASHRKSRPSFHCEAQTPSRSTSTQSGSRDEWHGHGPFEKDSTPLGSIHIRTRDVAVCTTKCPSNREVLDSGHQESDMDGSSARLLRGDQQALHHRVAVNSMGTKRTTFIKKESSADQKAWWHREVREERHTPQIHHQLLQKDMYSDRMRFEYGTPSVQSRCSRSANKTRKRRKRTRTQTRKHETVAKKK